MGEGTEEALAERYIELDAMADEQIRSEYTKHFGSSEVLSAGRLEMIERLLAQLEPELERSN
jgi:hypothetical protein